MRPQDIKKSDCVVPLYWRTPLAPLEPAYKDARVAGESVLDMVRSVPNLPPDFLEYTDRNGDLRPGRGTVRVNDEDIPHQLWAFIRPKPNTDKQLVFVSLHYAPGNPGAGGGSSSKSVVSLVAAFALVVVTGGIAGGFLAPILGASFATGGLGAIALSAAVGIGGALAISALSPPPSVAAQNFASTGQTSDNADQKQAASASGNSLAPDGPIPRVIGTQLVYPPFIGPPIVELVGDDEVVEAGFALNGPHELDQIQIAGVAIDGAQDVEFETQQGFEGDDPLTLVTRMGLTATPQLTLSVQTVNSNNQNQLNDPTNPADDLPVFHPVASPARRGQDEIWLHFYLPNGISINGSTTTQIVIPLRIQFRLRGTTTWHNLPELHLADSTLQLRRRAILLQWRSRPGVIESVPTASGFIYANKNVPGQTLMPATNGWVADSYFNAGSGLDYLNAGTEGTTGIKNVDLFDNRVEVYLDEATFPKGVYEIQIQRGTAYKASSFTPSTYVYNNGTINAVQDFFAYSGVATPVIAESRSNLADTMQLIRVCSIVNTYPVLKTGFALIAIKATNRDISQVSTIASGLVRDWDGSGWNTWTTTSNPAPHYYDILTGAQNADPIPVELADSAGLVAWRTECTTNGWTCDTIIDDFRGQDALSLVASCGYARPYQSDIYGVCVDDDTSAQSISALFSRRNCTNVRMDKAFARVPAGLNVTYNDASANYAQTQIEVDQRDQSIATTGMFEAITYAGLDSEAKAIARALFDMDQANLRGAFYYIDTDVKAVQVRKGDLVGLQHDAITRTNFAGNTFAGDGLIKQKTVATGNITGLVLDSTIPITNELPIESIVDISLVPDISLCGITTGIAIEHEDGTISTHALSNVTGETDTLTLATPFADSSNTVGFADTDNQRGDMVTSGILTEEFRRMKVQSIATAKNFQATLTLVDEAQALVRYAA